MNNEPTHWLHRVMRRVVVAIGIYLVVCWFAVAMAHVDRNAPAAAQVLERWHTYATPLHALALLIAVATWLLGRINSRLIKSETGTEPASPLGDGRRLHHPNAD